MNVYRFGENYIPENHITGFRLMDAGKDENWQEVYEIEVVTTSGSYYLPKMPLHAAELMLKAAFGLNIRNITTENDAYDDLLRETGQLR